jgi:hypothetical protein
MIRSYPRFLIGGALLAALVLVPCTAQSAAPAASEDFKVVPAEANLVIVLQMDKLVATDAYKKLLKEIPPIQNELEKKFRGEFGFDLSNVERMTVAGKVQTDGMHVIRCKSALKPADIVKARAEPRFKDDKGMTFKEEKIGTRTLYVPSEDYAPAFYLLDDKTMVAGKAKYLKPMLEDPKKMGLPTSLQSAARTADMDATVVILLDPRSLTAGKQAAPPPFDAVHKAMEDMTGAAITVKVGPEVMVHGKASCKDAAAAEAAKKAADAGLMAVGAFLKQADMTGTKIPKEIIELPGKVKTSTKGDVAEATIAVKDDTAIAFLKALVIPQPPQETRPAKPVDKPKPDR